MCLRWGTIPWEYLRKKNSTIGNSDDKGPEVGACLFSRNGKEASVVGTRWGRKRSQQLGGFVGHCKNFGFYSVLGSMFWQDHYSYGVEERLQGDKAELRKLVRMKLQQPLHASSGGGEKWVDSRNALKVELTGLAVRADAGSERKRGPGWVQCFGMNGTAIHWEDWRRSRFGEWVDEDRNLAFDTLRLKGITSHWCADVK